MTPLIFILRVGCNKGIHAIFIGESHHKLWRGTWHWSRPKHFSLCTGTGQSLRLEGCRSWGLSETGRSRGRRWAGCLRPGQNTYFMPTWRTSKNDPTGLYLVPNDIGGWEAVGKTLQLQGLPQLALYEVSVKRSGLDEERSNTLGHWNKRSTNFPSFFIVHLTSHPTWSFFRYYLHLVGRFWRLKFTLWIRLLKSPNGLIRKTTSFGLASI